MDNDKFAALEAMVGEVDAAGPPTPGQALAAQEADAQAVAAQEWAAIPAMVGGMLAMLAPELREVYSEAACSSWGTSAAAVAAKHGWASPAAAPELGLALSTLGLAIPSYLVIRGRLAAARAARPEPERVEPVARPAMDGAAEPAPFDAAGVTGVGHGG